MLFNVRPRPHRPIVRQRLCTTRCARSITTALRSRGVKAALVALGLFWAQQLPAPAAERVEFTVAASGDFLIHSRWPPRRSRTGAGAATTSARCSRSIRAPDRRARTWPSATSRPRSCPGRCRATRASARRPAWPSGPRDRLGRVQHGLEPLARRRPVRHRHHPARARPRRARHAGTARSPTEARRPTIVDVKGVRVAFLSYTAVSNGQAIPHPWSVNAPTPAGSWPTPGGPAGAAPRP